MKRKAFVAYILVMLMWLSACRSENTALTEMSTPSSSDGTSDETASLFNPALQLREYNIIILLNDEVPYSSITVSYSEGVYDLGIIINGSDYITYFGNYVVAIKTAFESEFIDTDRGNFYISLRNDKNQNMIHFTTGSIGDHKAGAYGLIIDDRSTSSKYTALTIVDDLCDLFPATAAYISKAALNENDIAIYEAVWDILDTEYWRSEDEILEELAPKYGMTAEELKQFLMDMMEKIY